MPFNLGDFFRKKGAKVEKSEGFDDTDFANNLGCSIESQLTEDFEQAHPELGSIINEFGERDPNVWAKIEALAQAGDPVAQQLFALEDNDSGDMASDDELPFCSEEGCYNRVHAGRLYCDEHSG